MSIVYDFSATAIDGAVVRMEQYRGSVILVVNVASQCGYTPQYAGLEALFRRHRDRGFVVLGFPCNQFGGQEPGTNAEIDGFCRDRYQVSFPMFAKVDVNGAAAHPLFTFLKSQRSGLLGTKSIKWNFTKFLIGRDGRVAGRFGSKTPPAGIEPAIVRLLAADRPQATD